MAFERPSSDNNRIGGTMPNVELKHYGVVGMRWGVRNAPKGSAGAKRNSLNSKIRAAKREGRRAEIDEWSAKTTKLYRKAEDLENKKVDEMKATTKGPIKRFFKRMKILDKSFDDVVNAEIKLENALNKKYGDLNQKRKLAKMTADKKIKAEWQAEADKMFVKISSQKLGFKAELKAVLEADKKLDNKYITKLLQEELRIEQDYNKRAKR